VSLGYGLTFKQAAITLLVVSVLSFTAGAAQLYLQWRDQRAGLQAEVNRVFSLVRGSAGEAAFQMHPELARQLINGLEVLPGLAHAQLSDNFGQVLAEIKPATTEAPSALARALAPTFADITYYHLPLHDPQQDPRLQAQSEPIGTLQLRFSAHALADRFLARIGTGLAVTTAQILLVSALVVAVFYYMITRPILRLSEAITQVDPVAPGAWMPPSLHGHQRDELGELNGRIAALLQAFQRGLNQRNAAERDLRALTDQLEQRVQRRTAELQHTLGDLDRQNTALEQAHAKLADANAQLLAGLNYARRIQHAMLPPLRQIKLGKAQIAVHWEPLQAVGGDWYWFESLAETAPDQLQEQRQESGQHLVVLADCTGHGVPGALMTLVVAAALERILHEQNLRDPVAILYALDQRVRRRLRQEGQETSADDGLEAAVLCLNVRHDRHSLAASFASAGIPLIQLSSDDQVQVYRGSRAQLGYASLPPPRHIERHALTIAPGDLCLLLTDGVTDQMGGEPRRLLGRRRFIEQLRTSRHANLHTWLQTLEQALAVYRGDRARLDDMTWIAIYNQAEPSRGAQT
jgi:serine phosphatase RsbU (regulator of sigma subunit)